MNKVEIIGQMAVAADIPQHVAEIAFNSIIYHIIDHVSNGQIAHVSGLGSFGQAHRSARIGRNPITGASIQILASLSIKFRPWMRFKNRLNHHE